MLSTKINPVSGHTHNIPPIVFGISAVLLWGTYPLWYHLVAHVPVSELLLHRILWSCIFITPLTLLVFKKRDKVLQIIKSPKTIALVILNTIILGVWWLAYTYAVVSGYVLEASLGYYVSPLLTAASGVIFFRENPDSMAVIALTLAIVGVAYVSIVNGSLPMLAIILACSYTTYTIIRKVNSSADSQASTLVENLFLLPFSIAGFVYLFNMGSLYTYETASGFEFLIFFLLGVINVLPLWWYGIAAKEISLLSISFLQYVPPTCNFLLAVTIFQESVSTPQLIMFSLIWLGIFSYLVKIYTTSKK